MSKGNRTGRRRRAGKSKRKSLANRINRQEVSLNRDSYLSLCNRISSMTLRRQSRKRNVGSVLFPFPVVTSKDQAVSKFDASRFCKLDRMLNVRFGEIHSPSDFWLYIENSEQFEKLMSNMHCRSFFSINANRIAVPEIKLCERFHCVCMLNGKYARAKIIKITFEKSIQVLFIDCGSLKVITSDKVWYLPKQFAKIQCQSAPAYLANIYASTPNREWCLKSCNLFCKLINNDQTHIKIMGITNRNKKLEVLVRSEIDNLAFYVNDYLVMSGYAFYTKDMSNNNHLITNDDSYKNKTTRGVEASILSASSDVNKFYAACREDVEDRRRGVFVSMYDPNQFKTLDPVYFPDCCRDYVSGRPY